MDYINKPNVYIIYSIFIIYYYCYLFIIIQVSIQVKFK